LKRQQEAYWALLPMAIQSIEFALEHKTNRHLRRALLKAFGLCVRLRDEKSETAMILNLLRRNAAAARAKYEAAKIGEREKREMEREKTKISAISRSDVQGPENEAVIQSLLTNRGWTECQMLEGE
jgi:hypothetical protein